MKSLLTKIISALTILSLCVSICGCGSCTNSLEPENCDNGHNLVEVSYTAPTCKTNGESVEKCTRCGFESKTTLLTIEHDYQIKSTTPSTCTVNGSQTLECSMCHETKNEQLPLKDHDYELKNTTASTCIVHGANYYQCKDCDDSYSVELPFANHSYETITKEATCFIPGGTIEQCSVCGNEKTVTQTPLLTHDFGDDGYCVHCGIYKTLFDENTINATYKGVVISGNLTAKFNAPNKSISDEYWKDHTVILTITMKDKDDNELEKHSFNSTTILHEGSNYGKLTVQYVDVGGRIGNSYANAFIVFVDEGNIFSLESRTNCTSFKIELSCDGYETIEKTYTI